ncbi:MAG: RNA polymerase sigma factor [Rubripirellula sp.]
MNDSNNLTDEAWLGLVFREHQRQLLAYATHLMGDADRAGDVVQDAFVRLCKQPRDQVEDRVRQWLYTVCRNRAMDILKKENRMKALDDANGSQVSRDGDPQRMAQRRDTARKAGTLIGALPKHQQEVIRLKVESDMSYREISELTGLTVSNVGYLLHTGLKSIRLRLATIE